MYAVMYIFRETLRKQVVQRLADRADAYELAVVIGSRIDVRVGQDAAAKSHLCRLADTQGRLRDAANFAGEPDLAEHGGGRWDHSIAHARRNRRHYAEVRCRLVH